MFENNRSSLSPPQQTISIGDRFDAKIDGSDHNLRPDIVIECTRYPSDDNQPPSELSSRSRYETLFAIAEVKKNDSDDDFKSAYNQLLMYSRPIYVMQWDRRFIWGITMCGDSVRACHFGNDHMLASHSMRLSEAEGRADFIRLLTYWSYCERHRLGHNPLMEWLPKLGCWRVEVPALKKNRKKATEGNELFYTSIAIVTADRLFGRHTRVFLATDTEPKCPEDTKDDKCGFVIKSAWPESTANADDDSRNEIQHLDKIREKLEGIEEVAGCYPTVVAGGRVSFDRGDSKGPVEDTAASVLGDIYPTIAASATDANDDGNGSGDSDKGLIPFRANNFI
ncbi:hypothetical protein GGI07_005950, partial [Coemansia sp. Benny D115]